MLKVVPVPVSWRQNEEIKWLNVKGRPCASLVEAERREKKRWLNFYVSFVPGSWRQNEEIKWLNVLSRPCASLVEAERRNKMIKC